MKKRLRKAVYWGIAVAVGGILLLLVAGFAYYSVVSSTIDSRMAQLLSTKSSVFLAQIPPLKVGNRFAKKELRVFLEHQGYHESKDIEDILPGQYVWDRKVAPPALMLHRPEYSAPGNTLADQLVRIEMDESEGLLNVRAIQRLSDQTPLDSLESIPKAIAAYVAGRVRTQTAVPLSEMPVSVRHAVMAIEDPKFLEHHGVSFRGAVRALWKNLQSGKASQGGSTITQQLMKNLFFSSKKVLTRKIKEAIYAFLIESRYTKESILEAYLNEVYLGQWSTHEIHGMSEGARYHFNRHISELTLSQSAMLAAIIQSPNSLDPRRNPERTMKRRNLVLKKMLEADFILPDEYEMAVAEPLGVSGSEATLDDIDYYLDYVMMQLPQNIKDRLEHEYLTIYVTLNPSLQSLASSVITQNVDRLVKSRPNFQKNTKKGLHLEGSLIAINPKDCTVLALQGGRNYRQTQFNRILRGKRQPGSLFKPFVALEAFMQDLPDGRILPSTEFEDSPLEWKYEGQTWKPRNYDGKFRGMVTVRHTVEDSINVPTARIVQKTGIAPLIDVLRRAGITSPLPSVPSLSLGSADVTPLELAYAYTTLANLGKSCTLRPFLKVYDENRNFIFSNEMVSEEKLPATYSYQTINIMKGTFTHGTARSAMWSSLNVKNFAGKTGTTNDAKDAWFVGFSPELLVLVWVGYDEKEVLGMTGSAAALPIWLDFLRGSSSVSSPEDFAIPPGMTYCELERPATPEHPTPETIVEYYVRGTEPPAARCRGDAPIDNIKMDR